MYISGIYKGFSLKAGESKQFQVIAEWSASAPESSETEKDVNVSVDFEQETDDVEKPTLSMPTYTVDYPNEVWTKEKNVTMTYPEGENLLYQYSIDGGKTWLIAPSRVYVLKYTQDGTLYIRVSDGISILITPLITIEKIDNIAPTVNISGNSSTWETSKTLTINASDQGSGLASNPYSWDGGKTWTSVKEKEFTSNQTVNVWVKDNVGNINKQTVTINRIDNQAPSNVTLKEESITSSSISVTASATQNQSGIRGYQFSINNGAWTSEQTSATKTFTGLTKNTSHQIKVRVYAKNGKYTDSNTITVKTNNIEVPTYSTTTNGNGSKTVTINYGGIKTSNLVYQYSIDGGYSWRTVDDGNSVQYTFFESGTIIARVQDTGNNNNTVTASTLTVTIEHLTIDVSYSDVTSSEATITATVSPSTVKISTYKFSWNGNSQTQSGNQMMVYNLKKNTYQTVSVMATTSDGRQMTGSVSFYTKDIPTPTYEVIDNGDSKSVTITYPGTKTDNLEYQYTIDGGQNWRQVYSGNSVQYTFTQNGTIQARVVDKGNSNNNVTAEILQITLAEKEPLTMSVSYSNVTSAGATIKATVNPTGTSIKNYQFKINNITYGTQSSNTFVVTGLTKDTLQRVSVTATATDGRTVTGSTSFYTNDIPTPTYSLSTNSDGSKTVTINYSGTKTDNLEYQYSIDGGYSWRTVYGSSVMYTFYSSGTIIARVQDIENSGNTVTAYTYTVTVSGGSTSTPTTTPDPTPSGCGTLRIIAVNSYIINNTNCQQMDQIRSNLRLSGTESTELVNVKIKAPSSNSYQTIQNSISIQPNKDHYVYYRVYSFPAYESCIGEEPLEMTLLVERQNGCPDVTATYYYGYSSLRGDWAFTTNRSLLD